MIHFVHVVHVEGKQAAVICELLVLVFIGWLAWTFVPEAWAMATVWLGNLGHFVSALLGSFWQAIKIPLAWLAVGQAVLLPFLALPAGYASQDYLSGAPASRWFWIVGLYAACAALLGYPALAGMALLGSIAAFRAAVVNDRRTFWLAATLAVVLAAWGTARYGLTFAPVCWLVAPASWCCLLLGAARNNTNRLKD